MITFRDSSIDGTVVIVHPSNWFENGSSERCVLALAPARRDGHKGYSLDHDRHRHLIRRRRICMHVQPLLPVHQSCLGLAVTVVTYITGPVGSVE